MREHYQIVDRWRKGSGQILVTLVRVQGSSYRHPGARLMVCRDGSFEGSISAGCLESDLLRKAAWLTRNGAATARYSTLFDETSEVPFGLGCGGVLDLLLEPIETPECQALLHAIEAALKGSEHRVATWLPQSDHAGMRAVFRSDGRLVFASKNITSHLLVEAWSKCLNPTDLAVDGLFVERLVPPQHLFIFGAGEDVRPLVTMACLLGWNVTVADGRGHLVRKMRFPESNANVSFEPDTALRDVGPRDAVVIMSHSYEQDREYLTSLLPKRPKYLGLLGSRQRSSLLIAEAASKLDMSVSACCERVSAPIGLDIGGEGPEAIALAITAEIQAARMGKRSESGKLSAAHVQRQLTSADVHLYAQPMCALDAL